MTTTGTVVRTEHAALHVRRRGSGAPLLLLHGLTDSGACWDRVAGELAGRFQTVAPDARGHGASSRVGADLSVDDLAEDAAAVVRALVDGPVAVWGHSMGAATAAALAAAHPELVARVVLEDPPFTTVGDPEDGDDAGLEDVTSGIRRMLEEVRGAPAADRLRLAQEANPDWDVAELGGWVESKLQFDEHVLEGRIVDGGWREAVSAIRAPVLLLTGDPARGAIVTPDIAAEIGALRPGTIVRRFAGAGHNVHREASAAVLEAVQEFLGAGN